MFAKKINRILMVSLLFGIVSVSIPMVKQRNNKAIEEKTSAKCIFPDSALPNEFVVYAVGENSAKQLDFPIDRSGNMATQVDLVVNFPSKPVVLMLGKYEPNIWNIKWTENTDIVAVLATGYDRQVVAGLPKSTPILTSIYNNGAKCGYFSISPDMYGYKDVDAISQKLFGQLVERIEVVEKGSFKWIGEPPENEDPKLLSSNDTPVNSYYDPSLPLPGRAGIEAALKKGTLRQATEKDLKAWKELQQELHPEKDVSIVPINRSFLDAYVVTDDFTYPGGLGGVNAVVFFVPEDVRDLDGDPGHSAIYDFKTGKCHGGLCNW